MAESLWLNHWFLGEFWAVAFFFCMLMIISIIDTIAGIIPNQLIILLGGVLLLYFIISPDKNITNVIFGMFMGGTLMLFVRELGVVIFGRKGIGMGDVKLSLVLSGFLGWGNFIIVLLIASILGLTTYLIFFPLWRLEKIPFAPFLSLGSMIVVVLSKEVGGSFPFAL